MYNQFDQVKTKKPLRSDDSVALRRGSKGTIVEVYKKGQEVGYHVEFTDQYGRTKALVILEEADIEPVDSVRKHKRNNVISFPNSVSKITSFQKKQVPAAGASSTRKIAASKSAKPSTIANGAAKTAYKTGASARPKKASSPKTKKPAGKKSR